MHETRISWAHATWNPWTGCHRVSKECVGCYAEAFLTQKGRNFSVLAPTQTWRTPYQLDALAKKEKSQAICFVCSMSDFFHADADRWRSDAWRVIDDCKNVNFMLVTKRPERISDCLPRDWCDGERYPNAWMGTTCGVRGSYERVDALRTIPCSLRFISIEPLMESVADIDLSGIGWVAVGGMSGTLHEKHQMKMHWAAEVYDLCQKERIPFLFKQSSDSRSERGINGLSFYIAERAGEEVDAPTIPLLRKYPATRLPLLPFVEHGKRFTEADYKRYREADTVPAGHGDQDDELGSRDQRHGTEPTKT